MRTPSDGFSVVKIIIIVLLSLAILGTGIYFAIISINSIRETEATAQAVSIARFIENQDAQSGYDRFHPDLKSSSGAVSWQIWILGFQSGNIDIDTSSPKVIGVEPFRLSDELTLIFETSGEYDLKLVMSLIDGGWFIKDYSVIE